MLSFAFAAAAVIAWSATAAVALTDLTGSTPRTGTVAKGGLVLAVVFTLASSVAALVTGGASALLAQGHRGVFLAGVIGLGALVIRRGSAMRGTSALVAPFGAILVGTFLLSPARVAPHSELTPLVVTHVMLVLVGMGTFALAAFVSMLYLLQERQLRRRTFGRLFHRLPSLEELDTAAFRLVVWGFVVYTVALVLGFAWTAHVQAGAANARVLLAVVAWGIFAAVIHTRVTTGWRGRASALMTVAGCAATYVVLAGYMAR